MVVYKVTVKIESELIDRFENYMIDVHVPEVLETGYFTRAEFGESETGEFQTRYVAESRTALDGYFNGPAEALRDDFVKNFPTGVTVTRDIIDLKKIWKL